MLLQNYLNLSKTPQKLPPHSSPTSLSNLRYTRQSTSPAPKCSHPKISPTPPQPSALLKKLSPYPTPKQVQPTLPASLGPNLPTVSPATTYVIFMLFGQDSNFIHHSTVVKELLD